MTAGGRHDLDDVDRQLLRILQADGRASHAAMAPEVGLSAPAVRLRVQRLIDTGVLQVVGVTDPISLGLPVMAMVGVQTRGTSARWPMPSARSRTWSTWC
jgi:Lrp/AsnC family transcriptional regulator for asnA, asnC and gidA